MIARSLHAVLRNLAEADPSVSDGELLRGISSNDERAFAQLIGRHGRLVWAVCRSQTRSEAEADDAFQATFLVLLKNAAKVREAGKLSSWLHGVAFKVCSKSRRAATRREARERATAVRERNGTAIPDSAWDRALAAVHDEVAKLPETLRVPFVLCCLQGVGVTEAAAQLGWKLGTLSGRLTRAKDAILARLETRGLSLAVVASVGLVVVPTAVMAKAQTLARLGSIVPGSILQLSQGVIGMSLKTVKVLAAVILLAGGLTLGVGSGWLATAEAQQPKTEKPKADPEAEIKRLHAELQKLKGLNDERLAEALDIRSRPVPTVKFKTTKWEYELVDIAKTFEAETFGSFLQERENAGWEFLGSTTLGASGGVFQWLFRRPIAINTAKNDPATGQLRDVWEKRYLFTANANDDPNVIEAEIDRLTRKKLELEFRSLEVRPVAKEPERLTLKKDELPLPASELVSMLRQLAVKKFGPEGWSIKTSGETIVIEGDAKVRTWAWELVKVLNAK